MNSSLYRRLIAQLDGLVVFMGLRDQEFFNRLLERWGSFGATTEDSQPPHSAEDYEQTILHSALVLGVAYAEAYLADAVREAIRHQPKILSTRGKNVSWEDVLNAGDMVALIDSMIEKELSKFTRQSIDGMLGYISSKLGACQFSDKERGPVSEASVVRNLIMHNGGIVNEELHRLNSQYQTGQPIQLSASQVHGYGLCGRQLLRTIDQQLVAKGHLDAHSQT